MVKMSTNLCMFEGAYIKINDEILVYVKREKQGYVVDVYDVKEDECIDSMTIWEDDFK